MARKQAAMVLLVAGLGAALLSGGTTIDPRTPPPLPGLAPPFLGVAVAGSGGLTAAVDAYGGVVDLRSPGPAGRALVDNSYRRQVAGSVSARTGIVPLLHVDGAALLPFWRTDSVSQRYLTGTNVVKTTARHGHMRATALVAVAREQLALVLRLRGRSGEEARPAVSVDAPGATCRVGRKARVLALLCVPGVAPPGSLFDPGAREGGPLVAAAQATIARAATSDRAWLRRARPLGSGAPAWAQALYRRSLLTLHALAGRAGAVAAGARDGWAYVWPRDAGAAALALAASGYRSQAVRIARFLGRLDLDAAARFDGAGQPVPGRAAQGDAAGWAAIAARAAGVPARATPRVWRGRADYQEGEDGDYLANAIAAGAPLEPFASARGLAREPAGNEPSLDAAAAWAVRPFARPAFAAAARHTLLRLARGGGRFGIVPGEGWDGADPWSAPTAWSAWALAALGERRAALSLLAALRRGATSTGALPERVDRRTGVPRSTTPLAWSHAFAVLALRRLWLPRSSAHQVGKGEAGASRGKGLGTGMPKTTALGK